MYRIYSLERKYYELFWMSIIFFVFASCTGQIKTNQNSMNKENSSYRKLTPQEERVIIYKGTEAPFSGEYNDFFEEGTYVCKRCGAPLYRSSDKFDGHCGWPSFDDEIEGAVRRERDADGIRTEILCAHCGAHLGHVFEGEGYTDKNIRHCVNSISMDFIPAGQNKPGERKVEKAYFAAGCFWGTEYWFEKQKGVLSAVSGYAGGTVKNPTYEQVLTGNTGHYETVEVTYDPERISYDELVKLFFNIHNPSQTDGQGPDIGSQYLSVLFYRNEEEKKTAEKYIKMLENKGITVATRVLKATEFYPAEDYHQDYYEHKGGRPYCHVFIDKFD